MGVANAFKNRIRQFFLPLTAVIAACFAAAALTPLHAAAENLATARSLAAQQDGVGDPRIVADSNMESGRAATWDCVWFGSYPQAEVKPTDPAYAGLQRADWDANGDAVVNGVKYRRISREDATSSSNWSNADSTYRYFKYEPIKWRVLDLSNSGAALVVSDVALDDRKYNNYRSTTWETCLMRSWLNGYDASFNQSESDFRSHGFIDAAFSSPEKDHIESTVLSNSDWNYDGYDTTDKVFLLTETEVYTQNAEPYGFAEDATIADEARRCTASDYAYAMGASRGQGDSYANNCRWWLRTWGGPYYAYNVRYDGNASAEHALSVDNLYCGVRPALNLDLSSPYVTYAGTVSSSDMALAEGEREFDGLLSGFSANYSNGLALAAARISEATYNDIDGHLRSLGFEDANISSENYGDGGALAFTVATKKYHGPDAEPNSEVMVIAAQGTTANILEPVKDATALSSAEFDGQAVYDIVRDFHDAIADKVNEVADPGKKYKVLVTGHSLGGAAANLVAANLDKAAPSDDERGDIFCYTFAAINSMKGSKAVGGSCYRNIHNVYNALDTFSPIQCGGYLVTGMGSGFGKFGHMDIYVKEHRSAADKNKFLLDFIAMPSYAERKLAHDAYTITSHVNHDMDKYVSDIASGVVNRYVYGTGSAHSAEATGLTDLYHGISIVACPVDVDVYRGGTLVGRVTNDSVAKAEGGLRIDVEDGAKVIYYPDNQAYDLRITATDGGSMSFMTMLASCEGAAKAIPGIELEARKQFSCAVDQGGDVASIALRVLDGSGNAVAEVADDGTEHPLAGGSGTGASGQPSAGGSGTGASGQKTIRSGGAPTVKPLSIGSAKVVLAKGAFRYTGKAIRPAVASVVLGGRKLSAGSDFTVAYANNKNAGTAKVAVYGKGNYTGTAKCFFTIAKAKNTMTAKAKSKKLKAKGLAKKKAVLKKLITVKRAKGRVTYGKASKAKKLQKFKVNSKTGAVTVPKNTRKGTYKLKVKVIARGNANYKSANKTVTVKITVK